MQNDTAPVMPRLPALLLAVGLVSVVAWAEAQQPARGAPRRPGLALFGRPGEVGVWAEGNRVYCPLIHDGIACTNYDSSPTLGGSNWPRGTADQYMFQSGLQVAGIVASAPGFAWSGDTVGMWVVDMRGGSRHSSPLTGIYDSRNGSDTASWPDAAWARDPALFHASVVGRPVVSLQDTWTRYWDGDPRLVTGRVHGMGLMVEQRSLQFAGEGLQDVLFLVYRLTNITTGEAAKYQGLAASGHTAQDIADIAALGAAWQRGMEDYHAVAIPDSGYTLRDIYAAFAADPDVGDGIVNYATASLPFGMAFAYKSNFVEPNWQYPPDPFSGNFAVAPGFVGIKFLATPNDSGLATFSTFTGCSGPLGCFPDPINVKQGYSVLNGTASAATGPGGGCQYPPDRHLCFLSGAPASQRTTQSTGPFALAPGQSVVLALAYVYAPALLRNPGQPSFDLNQHIGNTSLTPGVPPSGSRLVQGLDVVRVIDAAIGWQAHADSDGSGAIDEDEVTTVRGSLLHKAQAAQALFDNGFARPEAPVAPEFLLVPGDNRVTIVWRPSATETAGDPYFAIASNATTALHDPNYRQFDVEGYRLWRGTDPEHLSLVAQWDYDNTAFADYTGDVWNGDYLDGTSGEYRCAPELGITASCPAAFATAPPYVAHHDTPLRSLSHPDYPGLVQVPFGGRHRVANDSAQYARGALLVHRADTVFDWQSALNLWDSGVPFVYTDAEAKNGTRYYYAVTAFDVNSLRSGPSSLESPVLVRGVTPRVASGQLAGGSIGAPEFVGSNGAVVEPPPMRTIEAATGRLSGPMPPAHKTCTLPSFEPAQVGASGSVEFYVDTVIPGRGSLNGGQAYIPGAYHVRLAHARGTDTLMIPFNANFLGFPDFQFTTTFDAIPVDSTRAASYGGTGTFYLQGTLAFAVPGAIRLSEWGRGDALGDPTRSAFNGPRWWSGTANENVSHPNSGHCAPSVSTCSATPAAPTAGALGGVTTLMHVLAYNTVPAAPQRDLETITAHVVRAADFQVYWGPNGQVDSVMDRTHGVPVPFHAKIRASWGLLTAASFAGVTEAGTRDGRNTVLTWGDIYCVDPAPAFLNECGGNTATMVNTATLSPIAAASTTLAGLAAQAATGNGFIFYLNGHFFLMQMPALPPAGTVWNARFYSGTVRTSSSVVPTGYTFGLPQRARPPAVPGLHVRIQYTGAAFTPQVSVDSTMRRIHTVPDPYYGIGLSMTPGVPAQIRFVNVPSQAVIRIYSVSGLLTALLTNNDPTGGGEVLWDVKSRGGRFVASGVYFYHVEAPDGRTMVGRLTIVQ